MDIDALLPDMMMHVPTCPDPTAQNYMLKTVRDFLDRTRMWREYIEIDVSTPTFTVSLPIDDAELVSSSAIMNARFDDSDVAFILAQGRVKVLDFGIARAVTRPGQAAGDATLFKPSWEALTPAYASCEMFEQAPPDPRDDIYALACTAYELLAGHHPFERMPANQARGQKRTPGGVFQALASGSNQRRAGDAAARQFASGNVSHRRIFPWQP